MSSATGAPCTVCAHRRRKEIDEAIVGGVSTIAGLARTHGLSRQALMRHRDAHMGRDIRAVHAQRRDEQAYDRGSSLLDRMHNLGAEAHAALREAKNSKDIRLILSAIGTASKLLELQGRLQGEFADGAVTVNITHNDFRTLPVGIVAALEPFPDAKRAVLIALGGDVLAIEGDAQGTSA
jgi:hypothetical protein